MAGREGRSREARVMGLLKEMEENIVKEESQAYRLLHNIEDNLRTIVSNVDLRTLSNTKCDVNLENRSTGVKVWTVDSIDPKRPWTEIVRTGKKVAVKEQEPKKAMTKSPVRNDKVSADNQKEKEHQESSNTSLATTSSKVQQLKLFWDKFFLTETERVRSTDLLDKSDFVSEAKYEVLDKPKRKSTRKSVARILEKTIPPCRVPISFRMIPSKQNKSRKKISKDKDETFSEVDIILNREVSTYVAKIQDSSDEVEDGESDYSFEESANDEEPNLGEPIVSECFKVKLYNDFLTRQTATSTSQERGYHNAQQNKNIYHHVETGRQISCLHKKGIILKLKGDKLLHCYTEGVVVRLDEAIIIDPSVLVKRKKPERKPRKMSTLLPCYYFTVQDNLPVDIRAKGDALIFDPKKIMDNNPRNDLDMKDEYRLRTTVSYEKLTISSSSDLNKSHIKLIISKDEPLNRLHVLVIFTFSSFTILGFVIVAFKFFQGSFLF